MRSHRPVQPPTLIGKYLPPTEPVHPIVPLTGEFVRMVTWGFVGLGLAWVVVGLLI